MGSKGFRNGRFCRVSGIFDDNTCPEPRTAKKRAGIKQVMKSIIRHKQLQQQKAT